MRSAAQQPLSGAEQFKADVPERERSVRTGAAGLSGAAQGGVGEGDIVEAAEKRAYNTPHGLACRFSTPAEAARGVIRARAKR